MGGIATGVVKERDLAGLATDLESDRIGLVGRSSFAHAEAWFWDQGTHVTGPGQRRFPNLQSDFRG